MNTLGCTDDGFEGLERSAELSCFMKVVQPVVDALLNLPFESGAKLGFEDLNQQSMVGLTMYYGHGQDFELRWDPSSNAAFYRERLRGKPKPMDLASGIHKALERIAEIATDYEAHPRR